MSSKADDSVDAAEERACIRHRFYSGEDMLAWIARRMRVVVGGVCGVLSAIVRCAVVSRVLSQGFYPGWVFIPCLWSLIRVRCPARLSPAPMEPL